RDLRHLRSLEPAVPTALFLRPLAPPTVRLRVGLHAHPESISSVFRVALLTGPMATALQRHSTLRSVTMRRSREAKSLAQLSRARRAELLSEHRPRRRSPLTMMICQAPEACR